MDNTVYRGFDERAHACFAQLTASTDREKPKRKALKRLFIAEARRALPFLSSDELNKLRQSYQIAFFAYHDVKRRDGEAYIFHVVRGTLVLVWAFSRFKVFDIGCCHVLFQHDSYEEADDTWFAQTLIRGIVRFRLGRRVATDVTHLTQGVDESDEEYAIRLLVFAGWRSLLVKIVERTDNIWTLDKDDPDRSKRKLRDTRAWFVRIEERLMKLLEIECTEGRLDPVWLEVAAFLAGYLWYAVTVKEQEFN